MPTIVTDAPAPTVTTGPPAASEFSSAQVAGTINPNLNTVTWWFEYGASRLYGLRTDPVQEQDTDGTIMVQATLGSLRAATVYHYRLAVAAGGRVVYGDDAVLTTPDDRAAVAADDGAVLHLAFPLRLSTDGSLATVEQDTLEDVQQCVEVLLNTPLGIRPLAPEVGIEDPTFGVVDPEELAQTLEDQEDRAIVSVTVASGDPLERDEVVTVNVALAGDTEGEILDQ